MRRTCQDLEGLDRTQSGRHAVVQLICLLYRGILGGKSRMCFDFVLVGGNQCIKHVAHTEDYSGRIEYVRFPSITIITNAST